MAKKRKNIETVSAPWRQWDRLADMLREAIAKAEGEFDCQDNLAVMNATHPAKLTDYPLWRLLVMLDDAERLVGPDSESARAIAAAVQQKLHAMHPAKSDSRQREGES